MNKEVSCKEKPGLSLSVLCVDGVHPKPSKDFYNLLFKALIASGFEKGKFGLTVTKKVKGGHNGNETVFLRGEQRLGVDLRIELRPDHTFECLLIPPSGISVSDMSADLERHFRDGKFHPLPPRLAEPKKDSVAAQISSSPLSRETPGLVPSSAPTPVLVGVAPPSVPVDSTQPGTQPGVHKKGAGTRWVVDLKSGLAFVQLADPDKTGLLTPQRVLQVVGNSRAVGPVFRALSNRGIVEKMENGRYKVLQREIPSTPTPPQIPEPPELVQQPVSQPVSKPNTAEKLVLEIEKLLGELGEKVRTLAQIAESGQKAIETLCRIKDDLG